MGSGSGANLQGEENHPGSLPNLRRTWRDKLLLQALRETGDEMKRRRQTHKEVRARRAAEEEEAAMHSGSGSGCGGGSSADSHGSGHGSGNVAMVTLQAGGEGRWKSPLSRRTREYLASTPADAPRTTDRNNTHLCPPNSNLRGSPTEPEQHEEPGNTRETHAATALRHRRQTRRIPSAAHRGRGGPGTTTGGASEPGGGGGASGALGRRKTSARPVAGDAVGTCAADEGGPVGLAAGGDEAGMGVGMGEGGETAAAATAKTTRRASAAATAGRRRTMKGPRNGKKSGVLAALTEGGRGDGGGGMDTVSLTTSVEVTVLDGLSVDEKRESRRTSSCLGDGGAGGSEQDAPGENITDSGREQCSSISLGIEPAPLMKHHQPRRSTVGVIRATGVDDEAEGGADFATDGSPSSAGLSVSAEHHGHSSRRCSTVLQVRRSLAACKRAADEAAEANDTGPAEARLAGRAPREELRQEPPPAPFRGTFWDDDDGEPTLPARRSSPNLQPGMSRKQGTSAAGSDGDDTKVEGPAESLLSRAERTTRQASAIQQGDAGTGRQNGEVGHCELSDGGIGRRALSAHTKSEDNRRQFFQLYRRMARQAEIVEDTDVLSEEGHTPRQEFIRRMLAMGRMPVPILLRDPSALQDLNLAHRGLGDDVMCAAAEVLTRLPHINTLDVSDNRLTDRSLCKLCSLVVEMPGLKSLDLSCNKVDEAAAIIRGYLAHPSCSLQTLSLRSADVDDNECCFLMEAISRNQSLTKLDVSENKIGQNEMLNAVQPDVVTGGEAIAETLAGNAALKELNLSWNNLRQESAAAIGRALSLNRGLVSLNLAHNAFNDLPSQEVGDSLRKNSTLQSLDLSYNGLTPAATIVIASACKANTALSRLTLCGNRLGRQGSAALLSAIRKRTSAGKDRKVRPLLLGLEGCDCESDSPSLFDVDEPSGEYKLDMSLPYSRMVASELVALSATKKGFEIEGIWMAKDMESLDRPERRELVKTDREAMSPAGRLEAAAPCARAIAEIAKKATAQSTGGGDGNTGAVTDISVSLNGYERSRAKEQVMKLLEAVELRPSRSAMEVALDEMDWCSIKTGDDAFFAVFRAAFRVFDRDRSGSLELDELLELFQGLGCEMDENRCNKLISVYDLDRSGVLETEEFVTWMMLEHVRDPTSKKGRLMETPKAKPWPVPRDGAYVIHFRASRFPGDRIHVESAEGLAAMVENIRHMNTATERLRMFENAAMHTDMVLTAKQAEMMAVLVEHDQDRVMTAERLLPQVVNPEERTQFLDSFLNESQRLRLAVRMKGMFRAIMGNPTGFYTLDLASPRGRMTAIKLGEIANAERCLKNTRGACDTSQKGNRMMFRNEVLDTAPQNLTVQWFVKLPRRGIVRTDVVSTERPRLSVRPLSDARFESVKALVGVDGAMQQIKAAYELLDQQRSSNQNQNPGTRIWQRGATVGEKAFKRASGDPASYAKATGGSTAAAAAASGEAAARPKNGSGDNSDSGNVETAAAAPTTTAAAVPSGDVADSSKPNKLERGVSSGGAVWGRHPAAAAASALEIAYHCDALSVFRAKDYHLRAAEPDVGIPDCIIGPLAIEHWQQFHASSHFCLEWVEAEKRAQAAPPAVAGGGAGGTSTASPASVGGDGAGGLERLGRAGASSAALNLVGAGGDRAAISGGARAGGVLGPTRVYRWVFHRLIVLQTAASAAWYTCRQAMEIASAFPWQDFGRVQALIIVFSRIVDVDNFSEVVLSAVRVEERKELEHRLGLLNVHNPVRPDGPYLLDLKVWEEREWAKILIKLAVEEPGANWDHETYTHARGTPNIQGWLLPESWTRDDDDMGGDGGPRRSGILCLRYITDAGVPLVRRRWRKDAGCKVVRDLSRCDITDADVEALVACFDDVGRSNIVTLFLFGNSLTSLPEDLFDGFVALEVLSLRGIRQTTLRDGLFDGLVVLEALDLNEMGLASLPEGIFDELVELFDLRLSGNSLETLPRGIFDGLGLTSLDLRGNPLECLPLIPETVSSLRVDGGIGTELCVSTCNNGIPGVQSDVFEDICCDAGCLVCGGPVCFSANVDQPVGGPIMDACCNGRIRTNGEECAATGEGPCVIGATPAPTTAAPTTAAPTTAAPTTATPTTADLTTAAPTTPAQTTAAPTTAAQTTATPTTATPTTAAPTTADPTTPAQTTAAPTTAP
eukprot:g4560.t1